MDEGEDEVDEEAEEDVLGYFMLLLTTLLWLFDFLEGVTPLLHVGLSTPGGRSKMN